MALAKVAIISTIFTGHLGTISLNSSIFSLPAGVSPILMSMKTTGRVEDDMSGRSWCGQEASRIRQFPVAVPKFDRFGTSDVFPSF